VTTENPHYISLDEIIALRYKCTKCGTTVGIPRSKWGIPQRYCPGGYADEPNHQTLWTRQNSEEDRILVSLQNSIKEAITVKGMGCEISLEIKESEKGHRTSGLM
jgi:hypothetical protein